MQPYQPYQPQPQHGGKPRRTSRQKAVGIIIGAFAILIVLGGVASALGKHPAAHHHSPPPAAASPAVAPASSTAPAPAPKAVVIARFRGTGVTTTHKFSVPATWKLIWSYNCSAFGSKGNFIVATDGGGDPFGVTVNELGMKGRGSTFAHGDAGRRYLSVDSECSWKVTVKS